LNCTLWVKLSEFVQVTVAPTSTTMSAGANRYDFGMSTVVVRTGAAGLDDDEPQATTSAANVARRAAGAALQRVAWITGP
jgi:hypothetical protein